MDLDKVLRKSEEKFKIFFKKIPIPILLWKIDNNHLTLIDYNNAAEDITNGKIKDFIDIKASEIFKDQSEILEELHRCANDKITMVREMKNVFNDIGNKGFFKVTLSFLPPDLVLFHVDDITERKKVELELKKSEKKLKISNKELEQKFEEKTKELKESREKFRNLINNVLDFVWEFDLDGTFTFLSPQIYNILGFQPEEIIGRNILKFIHPEDIIILEKASDKIKTSGDRIFIEYRAKHKKEYYVPVSSRGQLVNIDGNLKIIGITTDITERKKIEKKLKESEEKYRLISENANDLIRVLNDRFEIEYINEATHLKLIGYSKNDLIGKSILKLIHPDEINQAKNFIKTINKSGEGTREGRIKLKNGSWNWFDIKCKKIVNNNGNQKFLIISRDITRYKEAEKKLKESEEKYRILFGSSPYVIILFDMKGNIIDCNTPVSIFLNSLKKKEDLIGKNFHELFKLMKNSEHIAPKMETWFNTLFKGKIPEPIELKFEILNRGVSWINVQSSIIDLKSEKIIQIIIQNIKEKKKAEQELKKLNNLKSELLRRTSHELKTPLVSIKGFSDLLLKVYSDKFDDKIISIINEIRHGCNRLENLINDILETSKLEIGQEHLNTFREDLSFLIKFSVRELRGVAETRNQSITLDINDKLIANFEKEKIHKVLSNLLTNAIKYTPPGGKIDIRSKIIKDFYVISIKDNGIGLTEEEKEHIFKQFGKIERYGQGLDIIIDGSGLGLYISKKIVELHGGRIWVESEGRNKGSTFYFSLPIDRN